MTAIIQFSINYNVPWIIRWEYGLQDLPKEKFEIKFAPTILIRKIGIKWWGKEDFFGEGKAYDRQGVIALGHESGCILLICISSSDELEILSSCSDLIITEIEPFYKKATPVDLQIEEKKDYVQFNGEAITEWNIDGKSEYQIKTIIKQMLIYSSAAKIKGNNDRQIAQAIITGFTGQLQGSWDFYLSKEAKNKILNSSIVDINGREESDAVNTLIYTILSNFIGANV